MRGTIGRILLGFAGGFLLSRLRAMSGGDAADWAGVEAGTAMTWRAAALVLFAVVSIGARSERVWVLLAAITAGYAVHGFGFGPTYGVPWILLVLMVIAVVAGRPLIAKRPDETPEEGAHPANVGECIGLFAAGVGVAIGLESVARHVRMLGGGLAQDDTVFGTVFLALTAFGAAAFGWMASTPKMRRLSFPVLLAATSAATFVSLMFLDFVTDGRGVRSILKQWDMRVVDVSTLHWDMLFSAAAFVAPALLLGAALAGARGRGSWPYTICGAAVGLIAIPRLLEPGHDQSGTVAEMFSAQLVPIASLVTLIGAALAALSESKRKPRARYVALFLIGLCGIPAIARTTKPLMILSPWEGRMIMPFTVFERGTGLATVEPSGQGLKIATLDRHLLTPDADAVAADTQRIDDSFACLPAVKTNARVLFVGQLTPLRSAALSLHSASTVDRTGSWWKSMARLEAELYKDNQGNTPVAPPSGEVIAPDEARKRIAHGDYDLVIAVPIGGDAPGIGAVSAPATTTVVRWLSLDEPLAGVVNPRTTKLAGSDVEHAVVLSSDGLEVPSFGIATNAACAPEGDPQRLRVLAFERDTDVASPWSRVRRLQPLRADAARASTFAAVDAEHSTSFTKALALFYARQAASPPFEHGLTRIELDMGILTQLQNAATEGPLDPYLRTTWSWIARVLVEKRDVANIDLFLAPLAAAHAPWTELEIALAYADLEGLDPAAAARRLEAVVARESHNWRAWFALGEAREIFGDLGGASACFGNVCELLPNQYALRRRYAMALTRVDEAAGRRLVAELLAQNPKDDQLKLFQGPDAPPPAPKSYTPAGLH